MAFTGFSYLAHSPWSHLSTLRHANIEHTLNTDITRIGAGTSQVLQGVSSGVLLFTQLTAAMILSWKLTLIVLGALSIAVLLLKPLITSAGRLGQLFTFKGRAIHDQLAQFLSGLKLAKVHRAEDQYVADFSDTVADLRKESIRFAVEKAQANLFFQVFIGLLLCGVIYLGLFHLDLDIALLTVFLLILMRLAGPFSALQRGLQALNNMLPAFDAVIKIIAPQDFAPVKTVNIETSPDDAVEGGHLVVLENVSFRYTGDKENRVSDINLTIKTGEKILIKGSSGGGKTTLVDIVLGLNSPTQGTVSTHLNDTEKQQHLNRSYVPQDPFIFDGTIRENLLWMNAAISDAQIWGALRAVRADGFVKAIKDGLDHRIGERGIAISGGERQRLCLARALLTQPKLLILDEATNALDVDLESEILESLCRENPHIAILIISHRPTHFAFIDTVWSLKNGRLTQA